MAQGRSLGLIVSVLGLAACASIAGVEGSDPVANGATDGNPDGEVGPAGEIRTEGGIAVSTSELEFSFGCGANQTQPLIIKNEGTKPQPFELRVETNPTFSIDGANNGVLSAELAPGESKEVTVTATSSEAGAVSTDLKLRAGTEERSIGARATVNGALVTIAPADFGTIRQNVASDPVKVQLTNAGNEPVTISGFKETTTDFDLPKDIVVPPNGSIDATVVMKPGPAGEVIRAKFTATGSGLCGAPPTLDVAGRRVNEDILVGGGPNFGTVGCGAPPPAAKKVTISNFSETATTYTATLPADSKFTITAGATGDIPKGNGSDVAGKAEITIVPKAPGNAFGDVKEDLTVTIKDKDPTKTQILMTVAGALIELPVAKVTDFRYGTSKDIALLNKGNAQISLCYTYTADVPQAWAIERDDTLAPNSTGDIDVTFVGSYDKKYSAQVQLKKCPSSANVPLCQPALPKLDLEGRGYLRPPGGGGPGGGGDDDD